ncbi:hypothetical protein SELMODRAFT_415985 [Selaginella moellendorffii]|uniref:Uncharacterized protein n=1 Tax=Selaginella moellendorffii TaxID=88036 RepID=D8RXQ4_SELML|nr:hypothetical protein SELMODRAFT_415985 [Selaginella moellendorffii]
MARLRAIDQIRVDTTRVLQGAGDDADAIRNHCGDYFTFDLYAIKLIPDFNVHRESHCRLVLEREFTSVRQAIEAFGIRGFSNSTGGKCFGCEGRTDIWFLCHTKVIREDLKVAAISSWSWSGISKRVNSRPSLKTSDGWQTLCRRLDDIGQLECSLAIEI